MNKDTGVSIIEEERLKKNKAAVAYYHANKTKVLASRKERAIDKKTKLCQEKGIPEFLVEYITFKADGQILLTCKDIEDCKNLLYRAKFKTQFTEDIINEQDE